MKYYNLEVKLDKSLPEMAEGSIRDQLLYIHPNVVTVKVTSDAINVELSDVMNNDEVLREEIKSICEKTVRSFRKVREQVLYKNSGSGSCRIDPHEFLISEDLIFCHQPGIYSYSGMFLDLVRGFDIFFMEYAKSIDAIETSYPTTVNIEKMRTNGYIGNFPHHALFVSGAGKSKKQIDLLAHNTGVINDSLEEPKLVLAPTVCYRCFEVLADKKITKGTHLFTATCPCHRNEGAASFDLSRLAIFSMREIVFVGSSSDVETIRQKICAHARDSMKYFELTARQVTAFDPFFASASEQKRGYQSLMGLKYEMQLEIPYANKSISCMSFNNHQGSLVDAYSISSNEGIQSGCVGYGLERLALAVFSQHGMNPDEWPESLRNLLNY